MNVFVNGKETGLSNERHTILSLIDMYKLNPQVVIVERNKEIIPKESYDSILLEQGDQIELVHFVGGG